MKWICKLIGHDFPFAQPMPEDIARWVKGLPPRHGISARCRRCGERRVWV